MADVVKPTEVDADEPAQKKTKLDTENVSAAVEKPATESKESTSETTKLEQSIIDQVEYYFSDANLFRDKFLQAETAKNDGWIPLATMITFKRLAALSTDLAEIANALDKSDEGLIEINEDRSSIRRHPERPLPEKNEETRKEVISRTAYVKGFPVELEMAELIEYFKAYPKVSHVVIRKYLDKPTKTYKSKGSVFATFSTRDQCAAFLCQEVKYKDTELITKWQTDYYAGKKTERQEKQKEKNARNEPTIELPKGAVLKLTDIQSDVTREKIKESLEALEAEVAFVDFTKGDEQAHVRLHKENSAKELHTKLTDGKLKVDDNDIPVIVVEGEDEEKYLAECVEKIKLRRKTNNSGRSRFQHKNNDRKRKSSG